MGKEHITNKWGIPGLIHKMENKFDEIQDMHLRILKKCGGNMEHAFKMRTPRDTSFEEITNVLENIITRTKIGRKYKPFKNAILPNLETNIRIKSVIIKIDVNQVETEKEKSEVISYTEVRCLVGFSVLFEMGELKKLDGG
ncbi:hypothetical protein VP01_84g3 [Puccinia sorghi]|uniref:Uncharacterized protein n=1 Tax=Puccinia sorghi TaxID=27349 RepID=A0A0L6U960_9BASI|nr:hypothetical protein VP01_84g3 [Puccinia sorghi]